MTKPLRIIVSCVVGVATFLTLLLLGMSIVQVTHTHDWFFAFLQIQILFMPMVLFLLLLAFSSGVVSFFILGYCQRMVLKPIEQPLQNLAAGKYDFKITKSSIDYQPMQGIQEDIQMIRDKLQMVSKELQLSNAQPKLFNGQTKEQILTEERHRLARELHDSVSQELFAAMMLLSAMNEQARKKQVEENQQKQLTMITDIITTAQSEMRALLLHLRPVNLEGKSLKTGIEQLLIELQSKVTIQIRWQIADLHLPTIIEDQLFRVVQELLSNTLRHAKAQELEVYLNEVNQQIQLRFIDDGIGFDISKEKAGSYGLTNIRERIQGVGGTVKIISFNNQGTSVEIKVPIFKEGNVSDDSSAISR